jgi:hypothetical protein
MDVCKHLNTNLKLVLLEGLFALVHLGECSEVSKLCSSEQPEELLILCGSEQHIRFG